MGSGPSKLEEDEISDIEVIKTQGREYIFDISLELGKKLPVVGGLIDLLKQAKEKYQELSSVVHEMDEVAAWANDTIVQFESIEIAIIKQGNGSPMDKLMKKLLVNAKDKIYDLIKIANHVLQDKNYEKIRGLLFKSEFNNAKQAFDNAKSNLQEAMLSSIYIEVTRMREMMEKMYNDSLGTCNGTLDSIEDSNRNVIRRSVTR
jgi:hypothetical protein